MGYLILKFTHLFSVVIMSSFYIAAFFLTSAKRQTNQLRLVGGLAAFSTLATGFAIGYVNYEKLPAWVLLKGVVWVLVFVTGSFLLEIYPKKSLYLSLVLLGLIAIAAGLAVFKNF